MSMQYVLKFKNYDLNDLILKVSIPNNGYEPYFLFRIFIRKNIKSINRLTLCSIEYLINEDNIQEFPGHYREVTKDELLIIVPILSEELFTNKSGFNCDLKNINNNLLQALINEFGIC